MSLSAPSIQVVAPAMRQNLPDLCASITHGLDGDGRDTGV